MILQPPQVARSRFAATNQMVLGDFRGGAWSRMINGTTSGDQSAAAAAVSISSISCCGVCEREKEKEKEQEQERVKLL